MRNAEPFLLAERPSRPHQRFAERYAQALISLHEAGFRWEVGPVEPGPPSEAHFSRLARLLTQDGQPWRWIRMSHEKAGPLGYLALFYDGSVRDESGRGLSMLSLIAWSGKAMELAARRIIHQNRINTAINEQTCAKARRELPWVRFAALATGGAWAGAVGLLRWQPDYLPWLAFVALLSSVLPALLLRWWYVRTWLARRGRKTGQ